MQGKISENKNEVSISIPLETLEVMEIVAKRKNLSLKSLLKLYVGQGLRQDMSKEEARDLALKRLASRKGGKKADVDLAA
jgi:transcriptional regulator of met regulon